MIYVHRLLVILMFLIGCFSSLSAFADSGLNANERRILSKEAVNILEQALHNEHGWIKIHSAESLIRNNYHKEDVRSVFAKESRRTLSLIYRIGVWRVLAEVNTQNKKLRKQYQDKILAALYDVNGIDRIHAAESLGKLGYADDTPFIRQLAQRSKGGFKVYVVWILVNTGKQKHQARLTDFLHSKDVNVRRIAGYIVRHLTKISGQTYSVLVNACKNESIDSPAKVYLLSALYVHSLKDISEHSYAHNELLKYLSSGKDNEKKEVCCALRISSDMKDIAAIRPLLNDKSMDVRIFAANAILGIMSNVPCVHFKGLQWLDWVVICLYGVFMLAIGAYYSRKQTNTEEYFLASRNMHPFVIGISMFATLLSTISYLGNPGEIIKHGPMILCGYLAVPFTYTVVGYILIPRIMKLKITSAYELLEARLGLTGRLVGSVIFILTRLVWMSLLIYISARLMVTMLNWSPDMIPWVVIVVGVIAVAYTAMGGLRAVVMTDVVQFFILVGGAIVTIVIITIKMKGFGWFPTQWAPHWDVQPIFSWNLSTRVTLIGSAVASFCWWVCTAGSDQVVIQRYLATRNAKAARRAFLINVLADMSISFLLYTVGFALLGFFLANHQLLPEGKNLIADADYLFPRFIANYLPMGLAGLVVAGMFAAAMSSLDSGINSIVTVFTRDFIVRLRKEITRNTALERDDLRLAKYLVLCIGIFIVLIGSQMGKVPGNIFEVTNKTNGLFVGPLFGLFFLALFVRHANAFGAIIGTIYGFMTAFMFAYWDKITGADYSLSFQLIIPSAVIVQLLVGTLLSGIVIRNKKMSGLFGIIALLPLVGLYVCLLRWGINIARYMHWGIAGN